MKVLWLIDSLTLGGAEAVAVTFLRHAEQFGLQAALCCLKSLDGNPFETVLRQERLPVTNLAARNLRDRRAFRRLEELLRRGEHDIVHLHLTYATIWGLLAARRAGRPAVATLHTDPVEASPWSRESWRQRWMVSLLRRRAVRVLAVSEAVREAWGRRTRLSADAIEVVPNGVPVGTRGMPRPTASRRREALGLPAGDPLLLTVAALRPGKGVATLLQAMARVLETSPHMRLAVVGDGPRRRALQQQAARLGLQDAVCWLGLRGDVPELLSAADLFVLPSERDALPTAVLEAMAAGVPVVASRVGGIPEIVGDGAAGILVAPRDPDALAAALARLAADPDARERLGAAGYERVRERFSLAAWFRRLHAIYAAAAGERPGESRA